MVRVGKASPIKTVIAERRRDAIALRIAGYTYQQIADRLGISKRQAYVDVTGHLDDLRQECQEMAMQLRDIELHRLDDMLTKLKPDLDAGSLKAIDRALRISESRRKLLGMDEAKKISVDSDIPTSAKEFIKGFFGVEDDDHGQED